MQLSNLPTILLFGTLFPLVVHLSILSRLLLLWRSVCPTFTLLGRQPGSRGALSRFAIVQNWLQVLDFIPALLFHDLWYDWVVHGLLLAGLVWCKVIVYHGWCFNVGSLYDLRLMPATICCLCHAGRALTALPLSRCLSHLDGLIGLIRRIFIF